ncbi:TPA: glycosyltransferase [Photobacterium damselae]
MKKKIAYVLPTFPTLSETFVGVEMRAMERQGHSIQPFAFSQAQKGQQADRALQRKCIYLDSSPYISLMPLCFSYRAHHFLSHQQGFSYLGLLRQGIQLAQRVKMTQCQHIHAHFAWHSAAIAITAAKLLNISVSFVGHGADIYASPQDLEHKLQHVDFACAVTAQMADELKAQTHKPIHHIACGIESDLYPPLTNTFTPTKQLLFIGRLVEKKGLHILITALDGTDITLDIIGDGPLLPKLQNEIHQRQLTSQIRFLGPQDASWFRLHAKEYSALAAPFLIAKNGDQDTGPLVVKEAMALGLPVITSDLSGCNEILTDQTGVQVKMGEPRLFRQAILNHFKRSSDELEQQRQSAYQHVMTHFNATTQAHKLSQIIETL